MRSTSEKAGITLKLALVVFAAIIAIVVMLGANLFDLDQVRLLALAVLAVAVAVVVP